MVDMTVEQRRALAAAKAKQAAEQQQGGYNPVERLGQAAYSTAAGLSQGATLGAYDEIASALGAPVKGISNLMSGADTIEGPGDFLPFLGRSFDSALEGQRALNRQAYEQAPAAFIAGDVAGSFGLGGGMAGAGMTGFGTVARPTIGGMAARGAVEGGTTGFGSAYNQSESDNFIDRLSAGALGGATGAALGGATGGVLGGVAGRMQANAVPSADALKQAGGDIYAAARGSGVVVPTADFSGLASKIKGIATKENVILPNGKVNSQYSAIAGPLDVLEAYDGRPVDIGQLLTIRSNIRDAAANPEAGVSRIGMEMFDEFNDYLYKLYPEIEKADDLYWRGKTGEMIDKLGQLAMSRAGQYSQSGIENALRAEFRLLERQIIKGRVKGLPEELVEQISKVAQGDSLQDAARWVSKFGVQNPITASTGVLAGLATGSAIPTVAIWGGAKGANAVARALAFEKYQGASALARSGGNLPDWQFGPGSGALVQGVGAQLGPTIPNAVAQALYGSPRNER